MHVDMFQTRIIGQAPAKLILFGEHAVLDGGGCVAVALRKYGRCWVTNGGFGRIRLCDANGETFDLDQKLGMNIPGKDLSIRFDVPIASGLGTSAITSILLSAAIKLDEDNNDISGFVKESVNQVPLDVLSRAHAFEDIFHGIASGADVSTSYFGGFIYFKEGFIKRISPKGFFEYKIVIRDSKIKKCTSKVIQTIHHVNSAKIYERIKNIAEQAYELLNDTFHLWEIYELIRANQECLEELGIVPNEMKAEVRRLRERGIESKITGAGCGGFMFTVIRKNDYIDNNWNDVDVDFSGFCFI